MRRGEACFHRPIVWSESCGERRRPTADSGTIGACEELRASGDSQCRQKMLSHALKWLTWRWSHLEALAWPDWWLVIYKTLPKSEIINNQTCLFFDTLLQAYTPWNNFRSSVVWIRTPVERLCIINFPPKTLLRSSTRNSVFIPLFTEWSFAGPFTFLKVSTKCWTHFWQGWGESDFGKLSVLLYGISKWI